MITGGFGITMNVKTGVLRNWYVGPDGIKRWSTTGNPVVDEEETKTCPRCKEAWDKAGGCQDPECPCDK